MHSCLNCQFHDRSAHNQCREPGTEMIRDRAASNFCDSFALGSAKGGSPAAADATRASLEGLFKF